MIAKLTSLLGFLSVATSVYAQGGQACNATVHCSASAPCCSEYGFCGSDSFCFGGCNPIYSHALDSCKPEPLCQNALHTFSDLSRIAMNATHYEGNATAFDWVLDKGDIVINNGTSGGELALLLTQTNGGTRLSSTRYVHYGKITTRLKSGRWGGVVTAFITMSDIRDEIDWEFPGAKTTEGQTNYFWQGVVTTPTHGGVAGNLTDTFSNYHDFTIDWQPDHLSWAVDGNVVRTIKQADTVDSSGVSNFPNTPSRIQLSVWPAGINTSAPGTVTWAGGMIDWSDPDYQAAGHFYALVDSVNVTCSDPTAPAADDTSYVYGQNTTANTPGVALSNASTSGAPATMTGIASSWGVWTISAAVLGSLVGAVLV